MMKDRTIYKKAISLAVPMMIQGAIANAVVLVDNLMVGSLGTESISGVSIAGQLFFVFNLAIFGGISGTGIYGAQYFGHGDKEGFQRAFRLKFWIAMLLTVVGIAGFVFFGDALIGLYLTGTSGEFDPQMTLRLGREYLNIMLAGLIPFSLIQVFAGSFREINRSIEPMVCGILSVIVDIIFNYILIYGKLGFPALGVRGAAIATVMARFVELAALAGWRALHNEDYPYLKDVFRTLRVPVKKVSPILRKSVPIFINELLWAGGVAALSQCYSIRGLAVVAGMNIANVLCNLLSVVFVNLGAAIGIVEGQFLGASEFDRARDSALPLTWFVGGVCLILTVILIALSGVFPRAYNTTQEVRDLASGFIVIMAIFFPIQGMMNSLYFILRSGGKTLVTFLFDSGFSWTVAVPLAYILCNYSALSILVILTIVQAAEIIKVVIGLSMVRKGIWITNLVA